MNESRSSGGIPRPRRPLGPLAGDVLVSTVHEGPTGERRMPESVILLLQCDESGTVGLRLNRPLRTVDFEAQLPQWRSHLSRPPSLFDGGPSSPQGIMCLGKLAVGETEQLGFGHLFDGLGLVEIDSPTTLLAEYEELRLFRGYHAWAPMELEEEIARGQWHLLGGDHVDVFTTRPETMWRRIVQHFPGEMAYYVTYTARPDLN